MRKIFLGCVMVVLVLVVLVEMVIAQNIRYQNDEYGISMDIPEGAIVEGRDEWVEFSTAMAGMTAEKAYEDLEKRGVVVFVSFLGVSNFEVANLLISVSMVPLPKGLVVKEDVFGYAKNIYQGDLLDKEMDDEIVIGGLNGWETATDAGDLFPFESRDILLVDQQHGRLIYLSCVASLENRAIAKGIIESFQVN